MMAALYGEPQTNQVAQREQNLTAQNMLAIANQMHEMSRSRLVRQRPAPQPSPNPTCSRCMLPLTRSDRGDMCEGCQT